MPTNSLPIVSFPCPKSLDEIFKTSGSAQGYHAVSNYLGCPEKSRLKQLGVRLKERSFQEDDMMPLSALDYGQLIHSMLAVRIVHGQKVVEELLKPDGIIGKDIHEADRIAAYSSVLTYDREFPLVSPMREANFEYIGVETPVETEIAPGVIRSARYDAIVRTIENGRSVVYSLEHKTTSRGGTYAMLAYSPQFFVQAALWNRNSSLVQQYGPMMGVIPDLIIKTTVPKCERNAPRYVGETQIARAIEYLLLPESVRFPVNPDGSYPRFIHTCWGGRYSACEYTELCFENAAGAYVWPHED